MAIPDLLLDEKEEIKPRLRTQNLFFLDKCFRRKQIPDIRLMRGFDLESMNGRLAENIRNALFVFRQPWIDTIFVTRVECSM